MEGIDISISQVGARGDIGLLKIHGFVDTNTSAELRRHLNDTMNSGLLQLIVDLGAVNYVSSAGWGVFVGELRGIRENGGDIKIVQMMPDVYEVFEMLEFNRILTYYDSIEEAINDFDISMGLDITKSIERRAVAIPKEEINKPSLPRTISRAPIKGEGFQKSRITSVRTKIDETTLPLPEKIKAIIVDNPNNGLFKIKKALFSARFGHTKISWCKLYQLLKKLNLDTKEKRYRYYRSR